MEGRKKINDIFRVLVNIYMINIIIIIIIMPGLE